MASVTPQQVGIPAAGSQQNVTAILATIRTMEGGCKSTSPSDPCYTRPTSGGSDACGAYQYISSTWQAMFDRALAAGYLPAGTPKSQSACGSPSWVQDAVATYDVTTFLSSVGGDVSQVPKHWYYPVSVGNHTYDGFTPPGNNITIGAYQSNWLKTYAHISGDNTLLASLSSGGGQQAQETLSLPFGLSPWNVLSPITNLFSGPLSSVSSGVVKDVVNGIVSPLLSEALYFGEIVGGFALIVLGVIIVLVDTGTLSKMPMPVPVPV